MLRFPRQFGDVVKLLSSPTGQKKVQMYISRAVENMRAGDTKTEKRWLRKQRSLRSVVGLSATREILRVASETGKN